MNIWIFQTGEPLHCDGISLRPMRAMNLAGALVDRGHNVVIFSSAFNHQLKLHRSKNFESLTIGEKLKIYLIPSRGYMKNVGLGRLVDHFQLAFNLRAALNSGQFTKPDIAFVGFPPIEAVWLISRWLKKNNVPFILDAKDQWPTVFLELCPKRFQPVIKLLLKPYHWLTRNAFLNATHFCSMSMGFLGWMSKISGRPLTSSDIVVPLTSKSVEVEDKDLNKAFDWWGRYGVTSLNKRRFCFIGSLSPAFNFQLIREVALKFKEEGIECQFVICGDGSSAKEVKKLMDGLENVIFPGWIDVPKIQALVRVSCASLAPYINSQNFIDNIPNKILDSLAHGLPIITTLGGQVRGILEEEEVGFFIDSAKNAYESMRALLDDGDLREKKSIRARQLFEEKYSYEVAYGKLVSAMEAMCLSEPR